MFLLWAMISSQFDVENNLTDDTDTDEEDAFSDETFCVSIAYVQLLQT